MTEIPIFPEPERGAVAAPPADRAVPRDPEDAHRALAEVQDLLARYEVVREQARHEAEHLNPERQVLVEQVAVAQHLAHLRARLDPLHPADVAYILESLPRDERLLVWDLVKAERDGEILVEVSDSVRETLIASMDRDELVAAAGHARHRRPGRDRRGPADRRRRAGAQAAVARGARAAARRAVLSRGIGRRADGLRAGHRPRGREPRGGAALPAPLRRAARPHRPVFVVDRHDVLKGALPLDRLLVNEPDALVEDVMRRDVLSLQALDEAEEAAQAFERYDLISAPVSTRAAG
jgi:magnesium transporter